MCNACLGCCSLLQTGRRACGRSRHLRRGRPCSSNLQLVIAGSGCHRALVGIKERCTEAWDLFLTWAPAASARSGCSAIAEPLIVGSKPLIIGSGRQTGRLSQRVNDIKPQVLPCTTCRLDGHRQRLHWSMIAQHAESWQSPRGGGLCGVLRVVTTGRSGHDRQRDARGFEPAVSDAGARLAPSMRRAEEADQISCAQCPARRLTKGWCSGLYSVCISAQASAAISLLLVDTAGGLLAIQRWRPSRRRRGTIPLCLSCGGAVIACRWCLLLSAVPVRLQWVSVLLKIM